jgi:4-alpha-glucanotransferase
MEMTDRDGFEEPVSGDYAGKPVEEASKRVEIGAAQ